LQFATEFFTEQPSICPAFGWSLFRAAIFLSGLLRNGQYIGDNPQTIGFSVGMTITLGVFGQRLFRRQMKCSDDLLQLQEDRIAA
jgi:hypothetical protein